MATDWLKLFPDAMRSKADFLLDGEDYFASVIQAMETTKTQGHYIYILGWTLDIDFELFRYDKGKNLFKVLERAAKKDVEVRILIWDNPIPEYSRLITDAIQRLNRLPNTRIFIDEYTFFPQQSKEIIQSIAPGLISLMNKYASVLMHPSFRIVQDEDPNHDITGSYILYRLLALVQQKTIGAHHEKIVIVKGENGQIAFCGGVDFNRNRVTAKIGKKEYRFPYYHDTGCRLEGPAAHEILQKFKRRWQNHPKAKNETLKGENEEKPKERSNPSYHLAGGYSVTDSPYAKVVGTFNSPDGREKDRSLSDAYFAIIENAKDYIYMEDQYLVNLDVARALNKKIKEPRFQRLFIAIQDSIETADLLIPNRKRDEFAAAVLSGATDSQKDKVLFAVIDRTYWEREKYHPGLHAKTLIVDDEIAIIGSANVNQRGFTVDSETSVVVFDDTKRFQTNFARIFRILTWKEFLRKTVPGIMYESTFNYPYTIQSGTKNFSILIPYGRHLQEDLDDRIITFIKKLNTFEADLEDILRAIRAIPIAGYFTPKNREPDLAIWIKQMMLHPDQAVHILFDILWEHFLDPKAD